jgi:hypothetical protein
MNEIAIDLGSVVCWSAMNIGFSGAHCYDWGTQQRLGYAAMAVMIATLVVAVRRFGRWT